MMDSPRRRYLALKARAADQSGTPEGELCATLAAKMLEAYPDLLDVDQPLPTDIYEIRWKDWFEKELLISVGEYLGAKAQRYANRKRL